MTKGWKPPEMESWSGGFAEHSCANHCQEASWAQRRSRTWTVTKFSLTDRDRPAHFCSRASQSWKVFCFALNSYIYRPQTNVLVTFKPVKHHLIKPSLVTPLSDDAGMNVFMPAFSFSSPFVDHFPSIVTYYMLC